MPSGCGGRESATEGGTLLHRDHAPLRPASKGYLDLAFAEYLELLDGLILRERIEKTGGTLVDYPPVLERLGVSATDWEKSVRLTSCRFSRELEIAATRLATDQAAPL